MDVAPLPKSQNPTVGDPVELSVKFTTSGEQPLTGDAEKLADGA